MKTPSESTVRQPRSPETEAAIRRRAEEIYEMRGRLPGHEVEDWLQAEADVLAVRALLREPKPAQIVVRVQGVTYTGEYDSQNCGGYRPGEFAAGEPIRVRFQQDKMYVRRPDGSELVARVISRSE